MLTIAHAQDTGVQQQIDQINGALQDIRNAQADESQRLDSLAKQISDLQDKINNPPPNNYASADDLKKLAEQLQEVDKKRQDDRDLILKQIDKLASITAAAPSTTSSHHRERNQDTDSTLDSSTPKSVDGYEYIVKSGDTLSIIAKAYRDQHIKVTVSQILKANPGLDPNKLYVGKKIIIPKSTE